MLASASRSVENIGDLPLHDVRALDVIPEGITPDSVTTGDEYHGPSSTGPSHGR